METNQISKIASSIKENIKTVIIGKDDVINLAIIAMLCSGHVLIEDVPGTGKTMLAKSLAASVDCKFKRIQFTPDLLPSDITGINFFNMKKSEFEFMAGPVFSNVVLADEINRATPKTQAGLLECMEERQVTIDGTTHRLDSPFMVIATQNPVDTQGVFPLPEAQLDRFLIKISMNYPGHGEGVDILKRFQNNRPQDEISAVVSKTDVTSAASTVGGIYCHEALMDYVINIVEATRVHSNVALGVSPRGSQALLKVSQAFAAIKGRGFVIPDDIKAVAVPVLAHRLMLKSLARIETGADIAVINEILDNLPVPTEDIKGWDNA